MKYLFHSSSGLFHLFVLSGPILDKKVSYYHRKLYLEIVNILEPVQR